MKQAVPHGSRMPIKVSGNGNGTETKPEQSWKRPKGFYYKFAKGRPNPFLLGWSDGGVVRWQSFETEAEREESGRRMAEKTEAHGTELLNFDPREWRAWLEFKKRIGDVDPMDILREWEAQRGVVGTGAKTTVAEAVASYLEFRKDGSISPDTIRHFDKHLKERFTGQHGAESLRDVTPDMIRLWLKNLTHPKTGKPMDAVTVRHHRKDLNTFLAYCVTRGWLVRNPCDVVAVPKVEESDVELLTVEEGMALFKKNAKQPVIGRLALEAFGFLRASSAGRLKPEHLNIPEKGIRMPGSAHKSGKTRFRQGHPENLWRFIESAPKGCWDMTPIQYRNEKHDAFVRAGITAGSQNRLRKTCLSAHLAWLKNPALTSYLAQHRHTSTTEIYIGTMTEAHGKAWFEITQ